MPNLQNQIAQANALRAMHRGKILVLPNAWDVVSARIIERAGFSAIATTSAGIAFSLGYPDGQEISREEMLLAITRITTSVRVPVSADVEAGYGDRPEDAGETARRVIAAGAVGMNLEDTTSVPRRTLADLSLQLERIAAVQEAGRALGVPIVLNARTDIYLLEVGATENRYGEALRRLAAFRNAGADCLFVPGLRDPETIRRLVAELQYPVNILAVPGSPSIPELEKLGVARVSLGSGTMRAALGVLTKITQELKSTGTYANLEGAPSHAELNRLMRLSSEDDPH